MRGVLMIPAVTLALAFPAAAQKGNPAGADPEMQPQAHGLSPTRTNDTDRLFAQMIAVGGAAEVEAGHTALGKAKMAPVKEFARRMVDDHGKANGELANWAKSSGVSLPAEPDPAHKAMQAGLQQAGGSDFDLAYMRGQVEDHQKTVQLVEWVIDGGQNAQLQQLATHMLPVVLAHLEMAQSVLAGLTGQAPPGSDAAMSTTAPAHEATPSGRSR